MKYFSIALAAVAMLAGSVASAATPIQFPIAAQNGSGEHGTATMMQGSAGVIVRVRLAGGGDVKQPIHIHKGPCAKLNPKPAYPLTTVADGISQTTLPDVTLATLQDGTWAINVHKSGPEAAKYVACGDIPKA
jgi:Cu/Zn superoxide dismutase